MYKLMELSDLYSDACIRDETGRLMFISLYGRDTAILQLLAAMTLKDTEGGISTFRLSIKDCNNIETIERVRVDASDRLQKHSGRLPNENLFGNLVHAWIYDPALIQPDKPNRSAWYVLNKKFLRESEQEAMQGVWGLYKTLSPVPLLDDWMGAVIEATPTCVSNMSDCDYSPIGNVTAIRVMLPEDFPEIISGMVKSRTIGLNRDSAGSLPMRNQMYT
jgi:hypothetical protein